MRHASRWLTATVLLTCLLSACGGDPVAPVPPPAPPPPGPPPPPPPPPPAPVIGDTLLMGSSTAAALSAIVTKRGAAAPAAEIQNGFIRTRLQAVVRPNALVGEVNAALLATGARIETTQAGRPFLTLRIPAVASVAAAQAAGAALVATGTFWIAIPAFEESSAEIRVLPASGDTGISHLTPSRLPAAWNVQALAATAIRVLLPDHYHHLNPIAPVSQLQFTAAPAGAVTASDNHGFHVAGILAANHDGTPFTGAFPAPGTLAVEGIPVGGISGPDVIFELVAKFPAAGRFLLSTSLGINDFDNSSADRFWIVVNALNWRVAAAPHLGRFLHLTSAGNRGLSAAPINQARWNSRWTVAAQEDDLRTLLRGIELPAADSAGFDNYWAWMLANEPGAASRSPNLVMVGSSSRTGQESDFSNRGSDLRAVGEVVFAPCVVQDGTYPADPDDCNGTSARYSGTSMSTPLVAGIAAYLWSINPTLTPVQLRARLQEAYNQSPVQGVLDAYWAVLRLDAGLGNAPVRRELLDVASGPGTPGRDGRFDEHDIGLFTQAFLAYHGQRLAAGTPNATDHSRFDLNGDGITGDTTRREAFDLNADGTFSTLELTLEGKTQNFNELSLSDFRILCYYAYSPLYQGSPDARRDALPGCVPPEAPPPLEEIPEGMWFMASGISFSGSGIPFPSPACQPGDTGANGFLPLVWTWTVPCTAGSNALTATGSARDLGTGSGQASVSVSGQFQSGSGRGTGTGSVRVDTRQFFRVSAPGHHYGQNGSMRIVIRRKIALSIPAFPITCAHHEKAGQARGELQFGGVEFTARVDRACVIDHGPATLTQEVTDTLPAMQFKYMRVSGIEVRIRSNVFVGLPGGEAFAGSAHVEYQILEFLDLPPGAIVETYGGGTWPQPAIGPAAGSVVSPQGEGPGPAGARSARNTEVIRRPARHPPP